MASCELAKKGHAKYGVCAGVYMYNISVLSTGKTSDVPIGVEDEKEEEETQQGGRGQARSTTTIF